MVANTCKGNTIISRPMEAQYFLKASNNVGVILCLQINTL